MKKIVLLGMGLFLMAGISSVQAQIRKIPAAVTEAFKAKYPAAKDVEYKDKLAFILIGFEIEGVDYQARFTNKGEWEQTEKDLDEEDLPAAVQDGLGKSKYADWEIDDVSLVEYKDERTEYKVTVKRGTLEKKYLFFSPKGKLQRDIITL